MIRIIADGVFSIVTRFFQFPEILMSMNRAIPPIFLAFAAFCPPTLAFAAPKFSPDADFPVAKQSLNACYFTSADIALRAKY